jgi:hypothetical protein
MVKSLFPNERLTYAAPLYFDRNVSALVLYGHSISGLDIDPEERVTLIRLMANASIALNAIELAGYRGTENGRRRASGSVTDALIALQPETPAGIRDEHESYPDRRREDPDGQGQPQAVVGLVQEVRGRKVVHEPERDHEREQ